MKLTIQERLALSTLLSSTGTSIEDALRIKIFITSVLALTKEEVELVEGKFDGKNFSFDTDKDPNKEITFPSEIVAILDGYYKFADENKTVTQSDLPMIQLIERITALN